MDKLYDKIKKELIPGLPPEFNIFYDNGKEIIIKTSNEKDLKVGVKIEGDNISYYSNPVGETEFEYSFTFDPFSFNEIYKMVRDEFDKSKTMGISVKPIIKKEETPIPEEPKETDLKDYKEKGKLGIKDLIKGRTDGSKRVKRSVRIPVINDVLEDAFILDEIDLKKLTVEELIKRMRYRDR